MKRNLLLCFDAFGTLFRIKQPIERQYGDVARRQFGLATDVSDSQLRTAFRTAFKQQSRAHPNYGRWTSGMGATAWWTQVIEETFRPFVETVPPGLAPQLLERFASSEGYTMDERLPRLMRSLKERQSAYGRIVVGVITNSDDRVPGILSSFGLRVSPLRYGKETTVSPSPSTYDIDFHCMSYDAGVEKPDPAIFRAAEELLPRVGGVDADADADAGPAHWDKVYVGDEAPRDVTGAHAAGWNAVLVECEPAGENGNFVVRTLGDLPPQPLGRLFGAPSDAVVVGVDSAASFVEWLLKVEGDSP
ncbi:hypothetical protein Sste5346_005260 [Sporothrix stenoceras]|uniref:Haloacid dehalogenase-like hydrolase n=1 Tax=Sporothrix stenoceras TaxID=5173 RepID=A0ABR3Z5D9_9PEZI